MAFRKLVVAVIVLVIFAGGGLAAYQVADTAQDDAARTDFKTQTNETVLQQIGVWQLVDRATMEFTVGFNNSTTAYNDSDHELVRGTDYRWNSSDGAVKFLASPNTTQGNNATITYDYRENTEDVQLLAGPVGGVVEALGQSAFLAAGIALIVFLLGIGVFMAKTVRDSGPRSNR